MTVRPGQLVGMTNKLIANGEATQQKRRHNYVEWTVTQSGGNQREEVLLIGIEIAGVQIADVPMNADYAQGEWGLLEQLGNGAAHRESGPRALVV